MLAALHDVAPAERARVPLDAPLVIQSSGRRAHGADGERVSSARASSSRTKGESRKGDGRKSDSPLRKPAPRSLGVAVATAVVATLAGVGVTLFLISLVSGPRKPVGADVPLAMTSASAKNAATTVSTASARPAARSSPRPSSTKPLDNQIQRDLP
jgi:hypothetical protein